MMSRLEGEERRRSSGFPFSDKAPYPPPFLGPAPHTDMGYFKVQVCSLPQKHRVPLEKKKHNSLLVFVFARSIKLTLVQARADCQLVRQTMHGRVPAARKPKAAQWQTSHRGICFFHHIFDETIFLRHFLDVKSNSKVRNADGMQNSGKADVLKKLEQFEQNLWGAKYAFDPKLFARHQKKKTRFKWVIRSQSVKRILKFCNLPVLVSISKFFCSFLESLRRLFILWRKLFGDKPIVPRGQLAATRWL